VGKSWEAQELGRLLRRLLPRCRWRSSRADRWWPDCAPAKSRSTLRAGCSVAWNGSKQD